MKVLIDIPEEFELDYATDRFAEFFHRCLADMGTCCGNYEQETAEMMEKAFTKSRLYDPDKVVEQIEDIKTGANTNCRRDCSNYDWSTGSCQGLCEKYLKKRAIEIVKAGGINDNSN